MIDPQNVSLKIDVEGYEFRILQSMDDKFFPGKLYLEDSCDKSRSSDEWKARLCFFDRIKKRGVDDIYIESRELDDEYLKAYKSIQHHIQFKHRDDNGPLQERLMFWVDKHAEDLIERFVPKEDWDSFEMLEFVFWMVNCHKVLIHYTDREVVSLKSETPLFAPSDRDWETSQNYPSLP